MVDGLVGAHGLRALKRVGKGTDVALGLAPALHHPMAVASALVMRAKQQVVVSKFLVKVSVISYTSILLCFQLSELPIQTSYPLIS